MIRIGVLTGGELSCILDRDVGRQEEMRIRGFVCLDGQKLSPRLVITQPNAGAHVEVCRGVDEKWRGNVLRITNVHGARCYKFLVRQNGQSPASGSTILPFLSSARALR